MTKPLLADIAKSMEGVIAARSSAENGKALIYNDTTKKFEYGTAGGSAPVEIIEDFEDEIYALPITGNWVRSTTTPQSGTHCLKSWPINDFEESAALLNVVLDEPGSISFGVRTSTEAIYDILYFYVNGVKQGEWHGETPWTTVQYTLPAGKSELKWLYDRDATDGGGENATYIDNIKVIGSNIAFVDINNTLDNHESRLAKNEGELYPTVIPSMLVTGTSNPVLTTATGLVGFKFKPNTHRQIHSLFYWFAVLNKIYKVQVWDVATKLRIYEGSFMSTESKSTWHLLSSPIILEANKEYVISVAYDPTTAENMYSWTQSSSTSLQLSSDFTWVGFYNSPTFNGEYYLPEGAAIDTTSKLTPGRIDFITLPLSLKQKVGMLESGSGSANTGDAVSIHGKAVPAPTATEDGKVLAYDSVTDSFVYEQPALTSTLQELSIAHTAVGGEASFATPTGYLHGKDILEVYEEGVRLHEDIHYTVAADGLTINLVNYTATASTRYHLYALNGTPVATADASKIQGMAVPAPTLTEDQKVLAYDNASGAFKYVSPLLTTGGTITGVTILTDGAHIIPENANMTDLGSLEKPFRDVYVGPNTLYINGNPVLSTTGTTLDISTSLDEHLSINTSGAGTTRLASAKEIVLYSSQVVNIQSLTATNILAETDVAVTAKGRIAFTTDVAGQNIVFETKNTGGLAHINFISTGQVNFTSSDINFSSKPQVAGIDVLTQNDASSFAAATHNHDTVYAGINHNHDTAYAAAAHNHDTVYVKQDGTTRVAGTQKVQALQITDAAGAGKFEWVFNATTGSLDLNYIGV